MHYHYLTLEDQFNQKYQALVDYLKMHENTPIPDILKDLAQLSNGHILKDFFVEHKYLSFLLERLEGQ